MGVSVVGLLLLIAPSLFCAAAAPTAAVPSAAADAATAPMDFAFHYEQIALPTGVTLSTLVAGNASAAATAVVLLHGFPAGSWMWRGVLASPALAAFRLYAPDLRGYNRSTVPPGGARAFAVTLLAADIAALINVVAGGGGATAVHLVAHDWGGAVAWWLAAERPELLRTLAIVNMAHPLGWIDAVRGDPKQQAASAYVLSFVNPAFTATAVADDFALLKSIYASEPFWPAAEPAYESSWSVADTVDAALDYYRANIVPHCPLSCTTAPCWAQGVDSSFDSMPNGGVIPSALPVLVQWGLQDTAFDDALQIAFIATMVRGPLSVIRFPNATHWLPQEEAGAIAANLASFYASHARGER